MALFRFWKQSDVRNYYDLKQELGKGTFSVVRLGINKKTGKRSAVKIINKKSTNVETKKMLETEIMILQRVNHPNVIALEALYETKSHLFLVMEYVEGGELFDRIVERGCFSERNAATIIKQILSAVKYLHANGIVHRDLKPENVLCATKEALDVKVADFGLSKIVDTDRAQALQTCCGTPSYAAPELLLCEGYGEPVDLWAVGVILYTLLSGCLPFYGETHAELFERILAGAYSFPDPEWTSISSAAKSLVCALLTSDPKDRLTAEEALCHPWLEDTSESNISGISDRMSEFNRNRKISVKFTPPPSKAHQNPLAPQIYDVPEEEEQRLETKRSRKSWEDERDWPLLIKGAELIKFNKDDVILKEGSTNRHFFRIKSGTVRVQKSLAGENRNVTLHTMTSPYMFGEISMLQASGVVTASIIADTAADIYQLNVDKMKDIFDKEHDLAERFYRELALKQAQRLTHTRQRIEELLEKEGYVVKNRANRTRASSVISPMLKKDTVQFAKLFGLGNNEVCLLALPCRWRRTLMHHGMVYISQGFICAAYTFFALKLKNAIPLNTVTAIEELPQQEIRITSQKAKKMQKISFAMNTEEDYKSVMELLQNSLKDIKPERRGSTLSSSTLLDVPQPSLAISTTVEVEQLTQDALTTEDWKLILDRAKMRIYKKDQIVIREGDKSPQNLYQVARGKCRVEQQRPEDDSMQLLGVIGVGETFGELSFLQRSSITASVVADDETVEIYIIEGFHLDDIFNDHPGIAGRFFKYLATMISHRLHHREIELLS